MKIGLAIHHHSPGYGGPFTVLSESAKYLYQNNIDARIFFLIEVPAHLPI